MDTLTQDLKYALRKLRREPGFAAVAVLTLALGIGATTAIFSVAHAVLFRPLPLPQPDRLAMVWESNPGPGWSERNPVSSGNFMDWRDQATAFEDLAAFSWSFGLSLVGEGGEPARVMARRGSPNLFRVLGVGPALGPGFGSAEEVSQGGPVAVISHGLWTRRYGADPSVVGREITLNERPVTIVGVMPAELRVPTVEADVWYPVIFDEEDRQSRQSHQWQVVGRLEEGGSLEQARSEMTAIADRQRERFPEAMAGFETRVLPFRADMVGEAHDLVLLLLGFVGLVLLVAAYLCRGTDATVGEVGDLDAP
jgi:predicted permease